jgi:hypothetical protein
MGERTYAERVATPAIGLASRGKALPSAQAAPRLGPDFSAVPVILRQVAATGGGGGGCDELLQAIIELLNEVSGRINAALDDKWGLFESPHPEHGSWGGHRDRFYYDRGRLRQKLAEWDSKDDCRGKRLSSEQQREMDEAREFAEREFPDRPAETMRRTPIADPALREQIRAKLIAYGVPVAVVGVMVGLVIAALADPEPFSKVTLLVGSAAAIALFALFGRRNGTPGGPVA